MSQQKSKVPSGRSQGPPKKNISSPAPSVRLPHMPENTISARTEEATEKPALGLNGTTLDEVPEWAMLMMEARRPTVLKNLRNAAIEQFRILESDDVYIRPEGTESLRLAGTYVEGDPALGKDGVKIGEPPGDLEKLLERCRKRVSKTVRRGVMAERKMKTKASRHENPVMLLHQVAKTRLSETGKVKRRFGGMSRKKSAE